MKVLHFSTFDIGGAGHASVQLHRGLLQAGVQSQLIVRSSISGDTQVTPYLNFDIKFRLLNRCRREWERLIHGKIDPDYLFLDRGITYFDYAKLRTLISWEPDIIVAHSISGFISLKELAFLQQQWGVPIVWHLMDMAPLTGGCHYSWGCRRFTDTCGACPALYSRQLHDQSYLNLFQKKQLLSGLDLVVIAPSHGLECQAKAAAVFHGKQVYKVLLSVNPSVFYAIEKPIAKQALELPKHRRNIFFGAHSITERRKGVKELLEALHSLAKNCPVDPASVLFTTAGNLDGLSVPKMFAHRHLGYLNRQELSKAYQAADVFLCPSIEDSGPMMINESIMSGTPVVSFDIGVAPDLVINGVTGYIAETKTGEDLANALRRMLELGDEKISEMSRACVEHGARLCSPQVQTEKFISIFDSLKSRNFCHD